jgi:hypothetical protein
VTPGLSKLFSMARGRDTYSPPYPLEKLSLHLHNDSVHRWRADSGIELIHQEPDDTEQQRIWKNWQLMDQSQKDRSDKMARALFGLTNSQMNERIRKKGDVPVVRQRGQYMSFPEEELDDLRQRLMSRRSLYTTRVSAEQGRYRVGDKVATALVPESLDVGDVQTISDIGQHPFLKELTPEQIALISKYAPPYDVVRLDPSRLKDIK